MEETKRHIVKISKLIRGTIIFMKVLTILMIVFGGILIFAPIFTPQVEETLGKAFEDTDTFLISIVLTTMEDVPVRHQLIVSGVILAASMGILLYFLNKLQKLFDRMIRDETPFSREMAESLRKTSLAMLILIVYSPVTAIVAMLLTRLMYYLFEYGAYLQERANETSRIQEEMILSFAEITENKSEQTGKHVRRVAEYSRILAEEMGLGKSEAERVRLASTMHDIGKLLIPAEILEKPARLTDEEFKEIKKHPGFGGEMLKNVDGDVMHMARTVALEHHERPDGRGYPEGKKQEEISLEGRIVAVADVYDALTSRRSYKEAWDESKAYEEIVRGKGSQFDTRVVEAFERAYPKINAVRLELQDV